MKNLILFDNKFSKLENMELTSDFIQNLDIKVSLGDYVRDKMKKFECFNDILGLYFIDLKDFFDRYFDIEKELKNLTEILPISFKILFILFLKNLKEQRIHKNYLIYLNENK